MKRLRRAAALILVIGAALATAACGGTPLPASVMPGSVVDVAWPGALTTLNTATATGVTPGDRDVSAMTRSQFSRPVLGLPAEDASFGTAEIVAESDDALTVAYDLADPTWSDGIALDAADLLLAWAAGAAHGDVPEETAFDAAPSGLVHSSHVPSYDEFERRIEVTFDRPVIDWQTALDVAVPAHVAGRIAFGLDDPMVAKQAVIDAIAGGDDEALAKLATVWNGAFDISAGTPPSDMALLSSGPYRIDAVDGSADDGDQRVSLSANREYSGETPVSYEQIVLHQARGVDAIDAVGSEYDVVQLPAEAADFEQVRDYERDDFGMTTADAGKMWALFARVDSWPLDSRAARTAFLSTVPRDAVAEASGEWKSAYRSTSAAVFSPDSDGYDIAVEDAGFEEAFAPADDPAAARKKAGVPEHTTVCILYDTDSEIARDAFDAIRNGVAEDGWIARDCGHPDPDEVVEVGGAYDAILTTVEVPRTPADIARQWGDTAANLTGATSSDRDELIEELSRATDRYDARDLRVEIERTIVDQRVVVPLAMDPSVIVASRDIAPPSPASGRAGALLTDPLTWAPVGTNPSAAP